MVPRAKVNRSRIVKRWSGSGDGREVTTWYQRDPRRLEKEVELMSQFTHAALRQTCSGLVWVEGLQSLAGRRYELAIAYPERFPFERPKAFVMTPSVTGAPHRLVDGSLCLFPDPLATDIRCTAMVVRNRAVAWFLAYEIWLRNGHRWCAPEH